MPYLANTKYVHVTLNEDEIRHLFAPGQDIEKALLERYGEAIKKYQYEHAAVNTGRMRASISIRKHHDGRAPYIDVGPTAVTEEGYSYPLWVEFGPNPHTIDPVTKKYMWWPPSRKWRGARHPVKHVNHPGYDAMPFIRPSIDEVKKVT